MSLDDDIINKRPEDAISEAVSEGYSLRETYLSKEKALKAASWCYVFHFDAMVISDHGLFHLYTRRNKE